VRFEVEAAFIPRGISNIIILLKLETINNYRTIKNIVPFLGVIKM